jgi:hypothetical protein
MGVLPQAHFKIVLTKECKRMDTKEEEETNMRYHIIFIIIIKNYKIGHSYKSKIWTHRKMFNHNL